MNAYPRDLSPTLARLSAQFPVIGLTGPRQSGKTTLARAVSGALPCVNLENPVQREFAQSDPQGFFGRCEIN
jgi:predicted AAA+ superfamily ATPase